MTKSTKRKLYEERSRITKSTLATKLKYLQEIRDGLDTNLDDSIMLISLSNASFSVATYYLLLNNLCFYTYGYKDENMLNNSRKAYANAISALEKVYTPYLNVGFADYEENLDKIKSLDELGRYKYIVQLLFFGDFLFHSFGEVPRLRWVFIDLKSRLTTILKNSFDLRTLVHQLDPRTEGFSERINYVEMTKRLLSKSANDFRAKYEGFSDDPADFYKAIDYLSALKRFCMMLNSTKELSAIQRQIDIWTAKLENDLKHHKEEEKEKEENE